MPVCRAVLCASLVALLLAACSGGPLREDVIAQARAGGEIAFDVVKIDDAVLTTVLAERPPVFHERFKKYLPPPELKIAVGDTVAVVIWESASNGLFGNSLAEWSTPPGALGRLRGDPGISLGGATRSPTGLAGAADMAGLLLGGAATRDLPAAFGVTGAGPGARPGTATGAGTRLRNLDEPRDLAPQTGRPGTRIPDQPVGSDGAISIPYGGRVKVADRTPAEVERAIEALLGPKALDPQALVAVKRSSANSVSVAGDVVGGKRVALSTGGDRLLQVIAAAGGAKAPVHDVSVRLSRGQVTASVPLATLVADPAQDIFAEPGDVLTLVRRPQNFSVFGATGKNAAIPFTGARLSLTEALAKAGGLLDDRADPRAVFLFRYEPVGLVRALGQPIASAARDGFSPIVYRLDLREAKSYLMARRFTVHDKDVIFVANAETVPIYRFFQALSQITGPVTSGLLVCQYTKC